MITKHEFLAGVLMIIGGVGFFIALGMRNPTIGLLACVLIGIGFSLNTKD